MGIRKGSQIFLGTLGPPPWDGAWLIPLKHTPSPRVTIPNLVALAQTISAYRGVPRTWGCCGSAICNDGRC